MTPTPPDLKAFILRFYNRLAQASEVHPELTDTEARDAVADALNFFFVWGESDSRGAPRSYSMFSQEGDRLIGEIVGEFLQGSSAVCAKEGLPTGQVRLSALQDETLEIEGGACFDEFIGWIEEPLSAKPLGAERFEPGNYEGSE